MPTGVRSRAPDVPARACTSEEHEALKRNSRAFRRATRFLGVQGEGKRHELRNCTRCGSTLTAPARKPGKSRRAAAR